jgi:tetratricopeptide (TPR) repeat protein
MITAVTNPDELIEVVSPSIKRRSPDGLAKAINSRWSPRQLGPLLNHPSIGIRCVACYVLGLVGDHDDLPPLTRALRDAAPEVNGAADQALWSIWFRLGNAAAQPHFKRGLLAMDRDQSTLAVTHFISAQQADPTFAEAYHQCAIAQGMLEQWELSEFNCRKTLEIIPDHFGALAGLGHCRAQLGDLTDAAHYYRQALRINPEMDAVVETVFYIESHTLH